MKKYLVIGNPIEHSLSPVLHNYWIKQNNIKAIYEKQKLREDELQDLFSKLKKKEIYGINVTVPFKKKVIPYIDYLSTEAEKTQSVNTIYLEKEKIIGHNTDIEGFELSVKNVKFDLKNKKILILGSGGVVPSLIFALKKFKVAEIFICNRTKKKAEALKNQFEGLTVIDWGQAIDFDVVINATSIGLKNEDNINLNFLETAKNKFYYDVIYNPPETNFLNKAAKHGNIIENGKMMFIYQGLAAFKIWHGLEPKINSDLIKMLSK